MQGCAVIQKDLAHKHQAHLDEAARLLARVRPALGHPQNAAERDEVVAAGQALSRLIAETRSSAESATFALEAKQV